MLLHQHKTLLKDFPEWKEGWFPPQSPHLGIEKGKSNLHHIILTKPPQEVKINRIRKLDKVSFYILAIYNIIGKDMLVHNIKLS